MIFIFLPDRKIPESGSVYKNPENPESELQKIPEKSRAKISDLFGSLDFNPRDSEFLFPRCSQKIPGIRDFCNFGIFVYSGSGRDPNRLDNEEHLSILSY